MGGSGRSVRSSLARVRRLPSWAVLAAGALAGGLFGAAYGWLTPPAYTATSYLVAVPAKKAEANSALGFAQAYGRVATQPAVLAGAQQQAGVPVRTLQRAVRAETSPDAPMVAVSATSARPARAADMANAVARALAAQANAAEDSTQVRLVQFSRAVRPTEPTSTSTQVTALVGASAGGLLCGLALLARPRRTGTDGTAGDGPAPALARPVPATAPAVPGPAAGDARGER
ncbi:lipopolysaccharide biosynthesis protein [Streptomyces sp. NPDC093260]|uniref:lipopolysaccharide biosynthesis protein n=1 Tax=Streptomyces sp. NPDC093260 TaxID=3155073 RepID=UPI003443AD80